MGSVFSHRTLPNLHSMSAQTNSPPSSSQAINPSQLVLLYSLKVHVGTKDHAGVTPV